jgi:polygalacturonase
MVQIRKLIVVLLVSCFWLTSVQSQKVVLTAGDNASGKGLVSNGTYLVSSSPTVTPRNIFNVHDYGAIGDGKHIETIAINQAIEACNKVGGGTVYLPAGNYLTGTVILKSHVTFELEAGALLLGSSNPDDYPQCENGWGGERRILAPLIYAEDAENLTLAGRGTIDGQGQVWWKRFWLASPQRGMTAAKTPEEIAEVGRLSRGRPQLIRLLRCKDVVIKDLNLRNSAEWTVHPLFCEFIRIEGITIYNPVPSPNTDGINPESCRNVRILNCMIDVGDDCVTLKSGTNEVGRRVGKADENITIANCVMLHGHGGVTIGSEMSGGVHNVTVTNCVFQGTDVGIRIKSLRGRGGVVEGVVASNITMQEVPSPFLITTFYQGGNPAEVFSVDEGTPRYRDFHFSNITARAAKNAGSITGLHEMPIENITFDNVYIQATRGFSCTNTKGIVFLDVMIDTETGPALRLQNAIETDSTRLRSRSLHSGSGL